MTLRADVDKCQESPVPEDPSTGDIVNEAKPC